MQRIADTTLTIPFGWQLALPDATLRAGTYPALRDQLWRYQDERGEERWNDARLQDCLCRALPPQADNCDEGERPHFADLDALPSFRARDEHVWGPIMWDLLHRKQISAQEQPGQWLRAWHALVPCLVCSAHFTQVLRELPPDFTDDEAFFTWSIAAHNAVNKANGKEEWTMERAKEFYGR